MEDTKKLEEIEKAFILDVDAEKEDYTHLINRVLEYAKVDSSGYVILEGKFDREMIIKDKIMLILVVRQLASKLQEKLGRENTIKPEVSAEELAKFTKSKKEVIMARAKDLKDSRKLTADRGIYSVTGHSIKSFLDEMDIKFNNGHI